MKLINIYNSLKDKSLHEQDDIETSPSGTKFRKYKSPKGAGYDMMGNKHGEVDEKSTTEKFTVFVEEEKTEVNIDFNSSSKMGLEDVTINWGEESHLLNFEEGDLIDDHGNEGKDITFVAYSEDNKWKFIVDVSVESNYEDSGNIQDVMWDSLEIDLDDDDPEFFGEQKRPDYADVDGDGDEEESMEKAFKDKEKMDEQGCTEEEIAEGTCGYGIDGKIGRKPAGSYMLSENFKKRLQKLANIK